MTHEVRPMTVRDTFRRGWPSALGYVRRSEADFPSHPRGRGPAVHVTVEDEDALVPVTRSTAASSSGTRNGFER